MRQMWDLSHMVARDKLRCMLLRWVKLVFSTNFAYNPVFKCLDPRKGDFGSSWLVATIATIPRQSWEENWGELDKKQRLTIWVPSGVSSLKRATCSTSSSSSQFQLCWLWGVWMGWLCRFGNCARSAKNPRSVNMEVFSYMFSSVLIS